MLENQSLPPHLCFVCRHVSVQFLCLIVRRAVRGEPHVDCLLTMLTSVGNREDLNIFRQRLQDFRQAASQTEEPALLNTTSAAEKLLHCQVCEERQRKFLWYISHDVNIYSVRSITFKVIVLLRIQFSTMLGSIHRVTFQFP